MKVLAVLFAIFAVAASQYYYEAPAVVETPVVSTYNSYLPYTSYNHGYAYPTASAAAYPAYYAAYGSNKGSASPSITPKLTNDNRAARI